VHAVPRISSAFEGGFFSKLKINSFSLKKKSKKIFKKYANLKKNFHKFASLSAK
jgi:hypothetical protein